jgi:ribosomal protein S18 acetylase RimI-like enzyme
MREKELDLSAVRIRHYTAEDRARCLAIFDSNVPSSFTSEERHDFERFLDALPGPYLLLESGPGELLACGGYAIVPEAGRADLCWGMVSRDRQGVGLGRLLALTRIQEIRGRPDVLEVAMNTSQHTRGFYEHLGFVSTLVTPNGIAPGLDRHDMRLSLNHRRAAASCE